MFAPHMFAQLHSQIFGALARDDPIGSGAPGSGVDEFADSLTQRLVSDGRTRPPPEDPGFGRPHNAAWIPPQDVG